MLAKLGGLGYATRRERLIVAQACDGHEVNQHVVQKERQPHTLALAGVTHQVHAVVPVPAAHERQAVGSETQAVLDGAHAMLVQRAHLLRARGQVVVAVLLFVDGTSLEVRHLLAQDARVAQRGDVAADGVGQPQVVVRDARADPAAEERMPPVLDVALAELPRRRTQDLLTQYGRLRVRKSHGVLQLIAESEGAP